LSSEDHLIPESVLQFRRYTVTYDQLSTAALTNDIELFKLPPGGYIQSVKIKHSTAFSGGLIATFTLSLGISGSLAKYAVAFDVKQTVADGALAASLLNGFESHVAPTSIRVAAISTVANLNAATAGRADIWVCWGVALGQGIG
jgi:hypothetical protein